MHPVYLILSSVVLGVAGQLMLKSGVSAAGLLSLGRGSLLSLVWRIASRPIIWAGLATYGVGTLFWLAALSQVELGYAYPFISLSYVLILVASWALFREEVSPLKVIGIVAICAGVYSVAGG